MELQIGKKYNVTVSKIIKVGAIVEMEDRSTELIHISNISNDYVDNIDDFITVGQTYEATCQEGKTKSIELTLRPLNLKSCKLDISSSNEVAVSDIVNKESEVNNKTSDLDVMINMMNKDYEDKINSKRLDRYHRKQHYKNKHNRRDQ